LTFFLRLKHSTVVTSVTSYTYSALTSVFRQPIFLLILWRSLFLFAIMEGASFPQPLLGWDSWRIFSFTLFHGNTIGKGTLYGRSRSLISFTKLFAIQPFPFLCKYSILSVRNLKNLTWLKINLKLYSLLLKSFTSLFTHESKVKLSLCLTN
jgi:hypothetical protein